MRITPPEIKTNQPTLEELIKDMRSMGNKMTKSFTIFRGEETKDCPLCGSNLNKLADAIEYALAKDDEFCACGGYKMPNSDFCKECI